MVPLKQFGQRAAWTSLLALVVAAGCSHPTPVPGPSGTRSDQPKVPFGKGEQEQGSAANSGREASAEAQGETADSGTRIPFHDRYSLPTGTLLTVRLEKSISTNASEASGTFAAIVDEPVVVDGVTLVPRGASVAGRVESSRASTMARDRGYVQLTLATIDITGQDLRVQTSSLFARADAGAGHDFQKANSVNGIHLDKGRRLTFRLTGPVYLASEQPAPTH
jgi:hypothetical protein